MSTFKDLTVSGNIACEGMITIGNGNIIPTPSNNGDLVPLSYLNEMAKNEPIEERLFGIDQSAWKCMTFDSYKKGKTMFLHGEWVQQFSGSLSPNILYSLNNVTDDGTTNDSDPSIRPDGLYFLTAIATDAGYTNAAIGYAMIKPIGRIQYSFNSTIPNPTYLFIFGTYGLQL